MTQTQATFNLVGLNGTFLPGISSPNYQRRENQKILANMGQVHQTGASVISTAPMASFSTIAVRALLGQLNLGGLLPWIALDGSSGMQLVGLLPNASGPGYASGSSHPYRQAILGDVYLKGIKWASNEVATADVDAFFLSSNGTTDPVASGVGAAPTIPVTTEQCVLTGITFGATAVISPMSFELSIDHKGENNEPEKCNNAGLPHPQLTTKAGLGGSTDITAMIETADLVTSYSGIMVANFAVLNPLGVGYGGTGFSVTLSGTITRPQQVRGGDASIAKNQLLVRASYDGTTNPLTIAVI